ncbi:MAG: Holliday junction resolvase RuvX [Planctomycetes bacterium]|nr:Holliday junction resolvase RuvX [Planctomycetota bacterium]
MARILAIDYGTRRFGLALSNPLASIALPLEVVEGEESLYSFLEDLLEEKEVELLVLGLPRNMNGSLGPKAKEVLKFKDRLAARIPRPIELWDERLTTVQAEQALRESGLSLKKRREKVDKVAAQILLQSFLDSRNMSGAAEGGLVGEE